MEAEQAGTRRRRLPSGEDRDDRGQRAADAVDVLRFRALVDQIGATAHDEPCRLLFRNFARPDGKPALDELAQRIVEVSERYGLPVDPRRHIHALSVGERQRVEIIRCLLQNPRLLIMDEPTSVLTPQAVRTLFETLRQLAAEGCAILYISHKLDEIQALCHTATVLRGGKVTGECIPAQETPASMARLMIGKDLPHCQHGAAKADGALRLRLAVQPELASKPLKQGDAHLYYAIPLRPAASKQPIKGVPAAGPTRIAPQWLDIIPEYLHASE